MMKSFLMILILGLTLLVISQRSKLVPTSASLESVPRSTNAPQLAASISVGHVPETLTQDSEQIELSVNQWHTFVTSEVAVEVQLSATEFKVLRSICAETLLRVMTEIASHSNIERVADNERTVIFAVPPIVGDDLRKEFIERLDIELGSAVRTKILQNPRAVAQLEASLYHFGTVPMAVSFVASGDNFVEGTEYLWTRVIAHERAYAGGPLVLKGRISRAGFEDVYGAIADRLLNGGN